MATHSSATECEPHVTKSTNNLTNSTKKKSLDFNGTAQVTKSKSLNLNGIGKSIKNKTHNFHGTAKATKSKTLKLNGEAKSTKNKRRNFDGTGKTTISNALKRRAWAVIKDRSIDAQSRALIRYALEINDPWLPELVRRVDAGETIIYTVNSLKHPHPARK